MVACDFPLLLALGSVGIQPSWVQLVEFYEATISVAFLVVAIPEEEKQILEDGCDATYVRSRSKRGPV